MEVSFEDRHLGEACRDERKLRKVCGPRRAKVLQRRLNDLRAAETLADMRFLPGHCHELTGDLAGCLSLDLDQPYRLLFRPTEETEPGMGGGLDWATVRAVVVIDVADTHS